MQHQFEVVKFKRDGKERAKLKITNTFGRLEFVLDGESNKPTEYDNPYKAKKAGEALVARRNGSVPPKGQNQENKP